MTSTAARAMRRWRVSSSVPPPPACLAAERENHILLQCRRSAAERLGEHRAGEEIQTLGVHDGDVGEGRVEAAAAGELGVTEALHQGHHMPA